MTHGIFAACAAARDTDRLVDMVHGKSRDEVGSMSRDDYPNLRLAPHSPNKGRGRLQRAVRRAFTARGPLLSSSELYNWCYPRRRQLNQLQRHSVWRLSVQVADPVARADTPGRPWLWKLREVNRV
jgi:hypothetical protein